jgi:uncharacterized cupin superfamily protein
MKQPIHESDVPWDVFAPGTQRELRGKPLCDVGGRSKIGVGLLELAPGSNTREAHWHSLEEEHLFVLDGEGVLRLGDREFRLRAGSYVTFPGGQQVFHHLENRSDQPFRYLMIGERIAEDRVTHER